MRHRRLSVVCNISFPRPVGGSTRFDSWLGTITNTKNVNDMETYRWELEKTWIFHVCPGEVYKEKTIEVWNGRDSDELCDYQTKKVKDVVKVVKIEKVSGYDIWSKYVKPLKIEAEALIKSQSIDLGHVLAVNLEGLSTISKVYNPEYVSETKEFDCDDETENCLIAVHACGIRGKYVLGVVTKMYGTTVEFRKLQETDNDGLWNAAYMVEEQLDRVDERHRLPDPD